MKQLANFLTLVLKYKPEIVNLEPDYNGWINVDVLIYNVNRHNTDFNLNFNKLVSIVNYNNGNSGFTFNNDKTKIKAN